MYRFLAAVALATLCLSASAEARVSLVAPSPGYVYFNRPGATPEIQQAELRACLDAASQMIQPDPSAGAGVGGGPIGAFAVGITRGILNGMATRRGVVANTENCMIVRGWRIVRVSDIQGRELAALGQAALAERLAPWIGAEIPEGEIVRVWGNDFARRETIPFGPAGDLDKMPLSITALAPVERVAEETPTRGARTLQPRAIDPVSEAEINRLGPDETLIVVRIVGVNGNGGINFGFARIWEGESASDSAGGQFTYFYAGLPQRAFVNMSAPVTRTLIYRASPGRWRINSIGHTLWHTSFCMGAPVFEVVAGEVVFLQFDLTAESRLPNVSQQSLQEALAAAPPAVLARARGANFINGSTSRCSGFATLYAFEIPDAPYLPEYVNGSRANATPATATTPAAETLDGASTRAAPVANPSQPR